MTEKLSTVDKINQSFDEAQARLNQNFDPVNADTKRDEQIQWEDIHPERSRRTRARRPRRPNYALRGTVAAIAAAGVAGGASELASHFTGDARSADTSTLMQKAVQDEKSNVLHIKPGQGFENSYRGKDGKIHVIIDRGGAEIIRVEKH